MTRHSRNNTAGAVFTSHERERLKNFYGTSRVVLGSETALSYSACVLCLNTARDPLICSHGHLFCRECVFAYILQQKSTYKQQLAAWEATVKADKEEEELKETLKETERLEKLEQSITGITKAEENEKKEELRCFWIPSLTPTAPSTRPTNPSKAIYCPTDDKHKIKAKDLVPVVFKPTNEELTNATTNVKSHFDCPMCFVAFSNSTTIIVPPCGHAICSECYDRVTKETRQKDELRCQSCNKRARRWITIKSSLTGYSGHDGKDMVATKFTHPARV